MGRLLQQGGGGCRPHGFTKSGMAVTSPSDKRQKEREEAFQKRREWEARREKMFDELPEVIKAPNRYLLVISESERNPGDFSAFVILRVGGTYPDEPFYQFADEGRAGLKVFLGNTSRKWLEIHHGGVVDEMRSKKLREIEMLLSLPIKIMGKSKSGKSAFGEIVPE